MSALDALFRLDRLRRLHLPLNGKALSILRQHGRIARWAPADYAPA